MIKIISTLSFAVKKFSSYLISTLFLIIPLAAIFSSPYYGVGNKHLGLILVALTLLLFATIHFYNNSILSFLHKFSEKIGQLSDINFWFILFLSGLGIRFMWMLSVPIWINWGDSPVNWELALNLVNKGSFIADTRFGIYQGLYPPGLPFILTPFIVLFGKTALAIFTFQSLVFIWYVTISYTFIKQLISISYARLGSLVIALFPPLIFDSAFAIKEPLLVALLTTTIFCLYLSDKYRKNFRKTIFWIWLSGANIGIAVLTQSSLAVIIPAMLIFIPLFFNKQHRFCRTLIFVLAAIVVISPWSIRQSLTFHKFVPLTTGGGWSFYTGNNPVSWGNFTHYEAFFPDLLTIEERDLSQVAFKRGLTFVQENPIRYIELILRRQMTMTCCPAKEGVSSLKEYNSIIVSLVTLLTTLIWLSLMIVIAIGWRTIIKTALNGGIFIVILSFPVISFIVHSLTEAGFRHISMHMCSWLTVFLIIISKSQPIES